METPKKRLVFSGRLNCGVESPLTMNMTMLEDRLILNTFSLAETYGSFFWVIGFSLKREACFCLESC